jgi:uncharacterized damage-inducible protein DinB
MSRTSPVLIVVALLGSAAGLSAQSGSAAEPRTASQVIRGFIAASEKQLTDVASEMPEDKYNFAPTQGEFRGVRTFAKQVKHAAAFQYLVAATILQEPVTADMADERGPDSARTKVEILVYLKESFAALNRAASTIDEKTAFAPITPALGPASDTRIGLVMSALAHSSNHYGQMVEYLRMNGIIPPASR